MRSGASPKRVRTLPIVMAAPVPRRLRGRAWSLGAPAPQSDLPWRRMMSRFMLCTIPWRTGASRNHNATMAPHVVEKLDLNHPSTARQVLALQRTAYRVEADLIGSMAIPQMTESLAELQAQRLGWIGVRDSGDRVVAALAFTDDGEVIEVDRLVVAPDSFRRGYGSALIGALDERRTVMVSTGRANRPAHALYESLGFVRSRDEEVVAGLVITHFRREGTG